MQDNHERDYSQKSRDPQKNEKHGDAPVTNSHNRTTNPGRSEEVAGDAYSGGFASAANPGGNNQSTIGKGEPAAEKLSEAHSNPDEMKNTEQNADLIPDSNDFGKDSSEFENGADKRKDEEAFDDTNDNNGLVNGEKSNDSKDGKYSEEYKRPQF